MTFVKFIGNISGCLVPAVSSPLSLESLAVLINPVCPCMLPVGIAIVLVVAGTVTPGPAWPLAQLQLGMAPAWPAQILLPVGFSPKHAAVPCLQPVSLAQRGVWWPSWPGHHPPGCLLWPPVGLSLLLQPGPALLPMPALLSCSPPTGEEFSPSLLRNFLNREKRAGLCLWD